MSYLLCTDSCADLSRQLYEDLDVRYISMIYRIEGKEYMDDCFKSMASHTFYDKVRSGSSSSTALINTERYLEFFRPFLQAGQDVLYIGFSSGLSGSFQSSVLAVEELRQEFPERKIYTVDSLAASMGQGLLVYWAAQKRNEGMSIEDLAHWVEDNRLRLAHWFTVDDLNHLYRGGRVSRTTAFLGTMLSIKPVMHVDNEGHLIPIFKIKGRKAALKKLVEQMRNTVSHPEEQVIFISHGDSPNDAKVVGELIRAEFPVKDIVYNDIGPVIGSHSGPGTVALFFLANER